MTIRPARLFERTELEALQWRASLGNTADREVLLANPDAIELPAQQISSRNVFVAKLNMALVGFAALRLRTDQDVDLDALFVEPSMQRRGIGKSLLEYCVNVARQRKCRALIVIANRHAKDFYVACGFDLAGESQTRFGAAPLMRLAL